MARQHTYDVDQLKARVETAKAALDAQLNALLDTEAWTETLRSMAVLGRTSIARFSFRNLMLLVSQRPEIHHAATFQAWRALGRSVRKGEKAVHVLKPRFAKRATATQPADDANKQLVGFSVLPLFALEQTDGAPLEPAVVPRDFDEPNTFAHTVEQLRTAALASCPHVEAIEVRARREGDSTGAYGWFNRATKSIVVLTDTLPHQQFATLVHELAHAILHGDVDHHARARKEVEAESTAFVVCHALGLDTASFALPYVATWANGDVEELAAAGENIRRASMVILDALQPPQAAAEAGVGDDGAREAA